ncbi:hypothetical protein [Thermocoleostomius sinensis]|uniref:Uncharacterized protein n=1 Tax=Thermocoleostomius sinensis A174 TaxID=2016057 RepID=A0A9E9C803_9CYAN|nr:hypothetical protein [Thermocoleostomius sinensis]WAL59808.1 hypothetical protein OXH18_21960 [Thermocoleostomius sinensis A174]
MVSVSKVTANNFQVKPQLKAVEQASQANLIGRQVWKHLNNRSIKPLWLYSSSILSIAIAISGSPVRAEGQFSELSPLQSTTVELDTSHSLEAASDLSPALSSIGIQTESLDALASAQELHTTSRNFSVPSAADLEAWVDAAPSFNVFSLQQDHASSKRSIEFIQPLPSFDGIELSSSRYSITGNEFARGSTDEFADREIETTPIETTEHPAQADLLAQEDSTSPPSEAVSPSVSTNRWQFSVEPYLFVPLDVEADVTVAGRRTSIDFGLDDILNLDRAFDGGLRLQAQRDRWRFILDGFYLYASDSGRLGGTFSAGSLLQFVRQVAPQRVEQFTQRFDPVSVERFIIQRFGPERIQQIVQGGGQFGLNTPVRVTADGRVSVRQITVDAAVSYRVIDVSLDDSDEETNFYPRLVIAPIVGVRTNSLRQTIEVDTVRIDGISIPDNRLPTINREFRVSRTLVEPLLGAEIGLALSDRWALNLRGDVSGFNIGADRNLTWNLLAGAQYRLSRLASLQLAYRFNSFDFEDGEGLRRTQLNLDQDGLWLSAIFQF